MNRLPSVREVWLALQAPARQAATNASVRQRLDAVLAWVRLAHAGTRDGGISKGYDLLRRRWWPSYPETTGYTIPTLLRTAADLCRPDLRPLAVSLAEWLISVATSEGGIGHWGDPHTPVVFDTGQAILGWLSAYETSTDERYLEAAIRAGDWLSSVQDRTGMWKDHQHLGVAKVIDTRVAWALLELSRRTGSERYRQAAVRNLEWALLYQDPDGWFSRCAFVEGDDPFTHTIAYTAEGLLECGCLLEEVRYVEAARLTADALLARQCPDGRLSSTYASGWRPRSRSTCLTGNCQLALLWLRLYGLYGQERYLEAARKAIAFVASTQNLGATRPNIRGGIAGSYPIWGGYERFQYPNWAAKFFMDALLALQGAEEMPNRPAPGTPSFPG